MNLHLKKNNKFNLVSKYLLPSIYLSPSQFPIETLKLLGFVDCYLKDEYKSLDNCVLLVFQPSIEVYEGEKWNYFIQMISKNNGLMEIVEYDIEDRIFGFWMKMHEKFKDKLIKPFEKGEYSKFPEDYKNILGEYEKKVCKKDIVLQRQKEKDLLLREGYLNNVELDEIPSLEKDLLFNYKKELV